MTNVRPKFAANAQRYSIMRAMIKAMRKKARLTQVDLAQKLNKAQSYFSKIETGERDIDLVELDVLCDACRTTLSSFIRDYKKQVNASKI